MQRPHVLRKTAKAQPKDPGDEVRDPFKNQEPGIAGDKAEPPMALRGGPAEPGDTSGDLVGARLPADKREPGSAGHCDMAKGTAVDTTGYRPDLVTTANSV